MIKNMIDIILLIIVIVIVLIAILVIYRLKRANKPRQVGPTCGFYALSYAVYKGDKKKLKSESRKAIKWAIKNHLSEIGEIFDIEIMQRIAKEFYNKESIITDFVPKEMEALSKKYYIIFPYQENNPHFCCIEEIDGNKITVYDGQTDNILDTRNKEELYHKNKKITFSWKKYVNNSSFLKKGLQNPAIRLISIYAGKDRIFYKWLRKMFYKRRRDLEKKTVHLNLKGKILLIEK